MKVWRDGALVLGAGLFLCLTPGAGGQSAAGSGGNTPSQTQDTSQAEWTHTQPGLTYTRPSEKTKLENYLFDAFGPYPIVGAAIVGGLQQAYNTPPEWRQGAAAYGERVGSNFGVALVSTTTRYGLAELLGEDTLYYRCGCKGFFLRFKHALISTLAARRGDDGHRVFSFPALLAPYAGTMTETLGWYPSRYSPKDAFRTGNYSLLAYAGGNVAIEFLYGGPHSLLSKFHLTSKRAAPVPDQ